MTTLFDIPWHFPAGLLIGFAAAAPLGPVNLIVLRRALSGGSRPALGIGLGAALGDALFATVAAFGLGALASLMDAHVVPLRFIGGTAMLLFAVLLWRTHPHLDAPDAKPIPARRVALAVLAMTITNPATLLFFASAVAAVGVENLGHASFAARLNSGLLVAGAFAGSMLWWGVVCLIARQLRGRLTDHHLLLINHAAAALLALFGLAALGSAMQAAGWI
ncbi:LysE family translocator [Sandaracinobacteroides saxicola]|uniref:LysE family transporter n=1 Tax=Sandaracinobacteroides saxicola TaxID=2759707 RepID=A0A7G5IJJ3_9SPHN|nr:LysE family transporter [Sandaracinobacteroides saxicola]QMW23535.1 LysE family transporter [Sandaracinobacteroides saxicola]